PHPLWLTPHSTLTLVPDLATFRIAVNKYKLTSRIAIMGGVVLDPLFRHTEPPAMAGGARPVSSNSFPGGNGSPPALPGRASAAPKNSTLWTPFSKEDVEQIASPKKNAAVKSSTLAVSDAPSAPEVAAVEA